jgi:hypothetical protein
MEAIGAGIVNSDQPAYLIALIGDFTASISSADGRPLTSTGRLVTLTVDAEAMRGTDGGFQTRKIPEIDTSKLGEPIPLDLAPTRVGGQLAAPSRYSYEMSAWTS